MRLRWAGLLGVLLGGAVAVVPSAPAAWLADGLAQATGQRLQLADARGTLWQGSAVLVLTAGPQGRSASALPGRLSWTLGMEGRALALHARQDCCINGAMRLRLTPGLGRVRLDLLPPDAASALPSAGTAPLPEQPGSIGQWPASWLVGLGAPWNTLQPSGTLQFVSRGLSLERQQGRWTFSGRVDLTMDRIASRLAALDVLGTYRLSLSGAATPGQPPRIELTTTSGALRLDGSGEWSGEGAGAPLRFQGAASAAPGSEDALGGLLNIIGRRQGTQSLITIG
jgi:general secretion pathway protein N